MKGSAFTALGWTLMFALGSSSVQGAETAHSKALSIQGNCKVSSEDEKWIEVSLTSWEGTRSRLMTSPSPETTALFFDAACLYRASPLILGERPWRFDAVRHDGQIKLPSDGILPVGVTSFAAPTRQDAVFFVMALPSVWESSGKRFSFDLRTALTAIMIHEMSHVVQFRTYLRQSASVAGVELLGRSLNDDVVQDRFAANPSFNAAVEEEARLLYSAAAAPTIEDCRSLAKRALAMMRSRQTTYYVNELRALAELEDIFLTMEGAGQFAALSWLIHPDGGKVTENLARREFGEGERVWSQRNGLALLLVLDRLQSDWRMTVYGDGSRTVLQLLEEALSPTSKQE